ncbi:MAG: sigma factor, partial [Ghiorsea sp.]|nr:sigma factor [Ghiorsea sp.]
MNKPLSAKALTQTISKLYKQESPKLLGVLTRIFGTHNFSLAEDVLQEAFAKAWHDWQNKGIPANPSAWLLTTAKHQAIDVIRNQKTKIKFADDLAYHLESEWTLGVTIEDAFQAPKIKDDQLRMLFMCCHESIKPENGIPFMLKALCGFNIPAIARALVVPEATIKKRLLRTRKKISKLSFSMPEENNLRQALDTVHTVLYLLFNEGFHSSSDKQTIRLEFCQDAIALVKLLVDEPSIANQETLGLFALMHFHIARIDSKVSSDGQSIPIDLQDRSLWTQVYIQTGNQLITYANNLPAHDAGRFYVEACIAKEHCNAASFEATNWANIITLYDKLIATNDSPVAKLNQSIAIGYAGDTDRA